MVSYHLVNYFLLKSISFREGSGNILSRPTPALDTLQITRANKMALVNEILEAKSYQSTL
jgi:hypothetical protein